MNVWKLSCYAASLYTGIAATIAEYHYFLDKGDAKINLATGIACLAVSYLTAKASAKAPLWWKRLEETLGGEEK